MTAPRLATYAVRGITKYGFVGDRCIVDLSARLDYPTLREAIEAGALMKLVEEGAKHSPDHGLADINWLRPIPAPEKIICFFFQAEDGIRDLTVTGVQTCALPI